MLRVLITIALLGVASAAVSTKIANWWTTFDHGGWSKCADGHFLTGMWRSARQLGDERIGRIEQGDCKSADSAYTGDCKQMDCYKLNIWSIFDKKGWATCKPGYFIQSIFSTKGKGLHNIEEFQCCKPRSKKVKQGQCYIQNVWKSFDNKGWSKCKAGYYMQGMFRNSCDKLYCLEEFKCCNMVATDSSVSTKIANWWSTFDHGGWSKCAAGHFLTGMWRSPRQIGDERIGRIEQGDCKSAPKNLGSGQECYKLNIWSIFDKKGWANCKPGYYMQSIYSTKGKGLHHIEEFQCCRPSGGVTVDGQCYIQNVWKSFDNKGWSKCKAGYYMQGGTPFSVQSF
eukprot:TCONS_00066523-protein